MSGSKFSSKVPKGEGWGVEDAVQQAATEFEHSGASPLIPCIAVIAIDKVVNEAGEEGPQRSAVVKLVRIEALTTPKAIRDGQKLILKALQARQQVTGQEMLPFEADEILRMAFGSVDVDQIEQDEREEIEDQNLTEIDRLRRHLIAVHGVAKSEIDRMETADIRELHDVEHNRMDDTETLTEVFPHDVEWWEWRRVIVGPAAEEAARYADDDTDGSSVPDDASELDGDDATGETAETGTDGDEVPDNVRPLFDDGGQAADGETEN